MQTALIPPRVHIYTGNLASNPWINVYHNRLYKIFLTTTNCFLCYKCAYDNLMMRLYGTL